MAKDVAKPLWIKITACGFAAVLVSSLSVGGLAFQRQYQAGEQQIRRQLSQDTAAIEADLAAQRRSAAALALSLANDPQTAVMIRTADRPGLLARSGPALAAIGAAANLTLITFVDAGGTAVVRVHAPTVSGDNMLGRRGTVGTALRTGTLEAGLEPGREWLSMFATAAVVVDGHAIGAVDVGAALTKDYFGRLKSSLGTDIAIHIKNGGKFDVQGSTFQGAPLLSDAQLADILGGGDATRIATADGHQSVDGGVILRDFSGAAIGVLEVASDVTSILAARSAALWAIALSTLAACSLVLIGFFLFARSIGGAIARLTRVMAQLAAGDLTVDVPGQARSDETGAMARAVQVFKQAAIDKARLELASAEQRRATAAAEERMRLERETMAQCQLAVVGGLAGGLKRLAEGDLTVRLPEPFATEYESLRADFNAAVAQLQSTMGVIVTNTAGLRSGASEITQAADDLSRRTEQQAASLEQTAAALDEITATVRKTADSANAARAMVGVAKADAEHSGAVVQDTVQAMSAIESSAREISQIIAVIDEIAFQTSLLALNAGVEAARAGDAGRGFAVVASEVRALAQRSASAAKEIKALISTSSTQVGRGVQLVDETGRSLVRIVDQVAKMSALVADIAGSAEEQASGLAQVNTAINQMDQVTQQNAAMVEQSTAASHGLAHDTAELERLTAKFRIGSDGATAASGGAVVTLQSGSRPTARYSAIVPG